MTRGGVCRSRRFVDAHVVVLVLGLVGCSGEAQTRRTRGGPVTSKALYPMKVGNAWSYDVESESPDAPTLLVNRVSQIEGRRVIMETGGEPIVYEMRRDGIYWPAKGGYLLKDPISEGAAWGMRSGSRSRIASMSKTFRASGQVFQNCVEILLESSEQRVRTLYARDVGPVFIEAELHMEDFDYTFRATLRGYQVE